jgi:hypothetical protein
MKKLLIIIGIALLFFSCEKESEQLICNCEGRWFIPRTADKITTNVEIPPDGIGLPTLILPTEYDCETLEALSSSYPHEEAVFLGCIE